MSLVNIPVARRNPQSLAAQVASILRKYGTDAHVYLPGIGVINGLTAGNYLDSAGTTPATVDNPVGLVLDGAGSVGAEIIPQPLNFTSGWNKIGTIASVTENTFTNTSGAGCGLSRYITTGKSYRVSVTYTKSDSTTLFGIYDDSSASVISTSTASSGTFTANYLATGPLYLRLAGNASVTVTNISVKEVTGIHALQATTANKPILRRGAVNLLTYSEQFDNAAWGKNSGGISANAIIAPNGTTTADKLVATKTVTQQWVYRTALPVINGSSCTFSCYMKVGEYRYGQVRIISGSTIASVGFDLQTGEIYSTALGTGSITSVGNGWYRCTVAGVAAASTAEIYINVNNSAALTTAFAGNGTDGIYVWGAQLQTGSTATDYVATTTAAASSPTGNYWWQFADSTDVLTATFPAGYESATDISTSRTGQNTRETVNVVGDYKIAGAILNTDLIPNAADREFSSDTGYWNRNAGWTISGGKLVATTAAQYTSTSKASLLTIGKKYLVTLTVEIATGAPAIAAGSTNSSNLVAGINRVLIVPATNGTFYITNNSATAFTGTIDNISILELSDSEYARFIFRTGLSASELTTIQTFANRLAGV